MLYMIENDINNCYLNSIVTRNLESQPPAEDESESGYDSGSIGLSDELNEPAPEDNENISEEAEDEAKDFDVDEADTEEEKVEDKDEAKGSETEGSGTALPEAE
ncbi:MAG: hypothetical protein MHPSP_004781, partial [Paramarteilia canceri]